MSRTKEIFVDRGFYIVRSRAIVRPVAKATGEPFTKWKEFKIVSKVHVGMARNRDMIQHVVESDLIHIFSKEFLKNIRSHKPLKDKVGRTVWNVEIKDLVFKLDMTEVVN